MIFMSRLGLLFLVCALALSLPSGQAATGPDDVVRVGPGIKPPRLLHKVEPEYSPLARADHIQGTVVFQVVVNEKGRLADISVLSPLGYGLDERAQTAIETWEFAPGTRDDKPVKILATIEVNFRFLDVWFDEKAERRRTSFNIAVQTLHRTNATVKAVDGAVTSMRELSRKNFSAAMYALGLMEIGGDHVIADPEGGLALVRMAADKNYGPALYEIGVRRIEGRDLPKDVEKGLAEMRQAATLGSQQAQFHLGSRYEQGIGVPRELDRARRYFRLCAVQGVAQCQYRLGRLLFDEEDRLERDYVQAVALFQLAGENGVQDAKAIASRETANLTPAQSKWVSTLRTQLLRKQD